ncbi:tyrosine-type recombinase/integrase [Psychroflexus planctonicus]|uniref:Integrase n=1 Tax=Psychroflexus planctonicus TaxID=1526575 RepID=A0ABQ1SEX6_9FLAO|nr:site-specific integrase [Psychroflexus planctonicus]GGE27545.1 integrase [Psychroflexus planctonicus]
MNSITLNLELNKSHKNKRGLHSIRLFIYNSFTKERYYFRTPFKLSKADFENSWIKNKSAAKHRNMNLEMSKFLDKVDNCILKMKNFDKDEFKELFYGSGGKKNLKYYYNKKINDFKDIGSYGTAQTYLNSQKFLKKYNNDKELDFNQINSKWLFKFDKYCTENGLLSVSSLGIYLRPLRTIFNLAIHEGVIPKEKYPFGRFGYTIPQAENKKKALTKSQVQQLFDIRPKSTAQKMAKDFWFFSYLTNGLNLKDIIMIKNRDLKDDYFLYERKKTQYNVKKRFTSKIYLTDFTKSVLNQYGNPDPNKPDDFVFNILNRNMSNEEQYKKKKDFNRRINRHFSKLVEMSDIDEKVSFYWARHSFATISILNGVRLEAVSKKLNHTSLETTMLYFKGFEEETYQKINSKILEFSNQEDDDKLSNLQSSLSIK